MTLHRLEGVGIGGGAGGKEAAGKCFISLKEIPQLASKSSRLNVSFTFITTDRDAAAKSNATWKK